jgi:hypothetical protein
VGFVLSDGVAFVGFRRLELLQRLLLMVLFAVEVLFRSEVVPSAAVLAAVWWCRL